MHILHTFISQKRGGVEQAFLDYTKLLHTSGHRVTTLTHSRFPDNLAFAPYTDAMHTITPWSVHDPFAPNHVQRIIRSIAPDIIIAHGNRAIRLIRKVRNLSVPLIAVLHGDNIRHALGSHTIITVNEAIAKKAIEAKQAPGTVHILPNMLATPDLPLASRSASSFVIGALGRFTKEKGFDVLLQAFAALPDTNATLILAGEGEDHNCLQTLAKTLGVAERVTFPGWLDEADKEAFFRTIDLLCVPSRHESFGLVILEAWRQGVPVVATSTDGPASLIIHGKNGLLVPINDPALLADAIGQLLHNPLMRETLGREGYATLQAQYTPEKIREQLESILEDVAMPAHTTSAR
ncbi:MAG: glycosyltransferase [Rickettsiales bacterium]|jgi:glycosyltransferase involved in cell wall biosynthesis|nr:glycosyltransferase [Rickettsiales bacterium]